MLADLERGGALTRDSMTSDGLAQFVAGTLLLSQPHNYSAALHGQEPAIASRDVKRALEFMEANLGARISLGDIATVAGVPGRTLLKHFERFWGMSPMQHLRAARLEKVHETLSRGAAGRTITDVALAWGFPHLSRFASDYRQRFGERPSDTLKRAR